MFLEFEDGYLGSRVAIRGGKEAVGAVGVEREQWEQKGDDNWQAVFDQ